MSRKKDTFSSIFLAARLNTLMHQLYLSLFRCSITFELFWICIWFNMSKIAKLDYISLLTLVSQKQQKLQELLENFLRIHEIWLNNDG